MDLSYWTQLNPKIVYEPTRKQFFSQYCYKLVLEVYGGRIINTSNNELIADAISDRRDRYRNYGGSWYSRQRNEVDKINPALLEELRSIKNGYNNIRLRVEEPWVQVYAKDEDTLKSIAWRLKAFNNSFISISTPQTPGQQHLLEQGNIILRTTSKINYKYKVVLRDGMYDQKTKTQLLNCIDAHGEDAQLTKANRNMLEGPLIYIWGCFVYTDDPGIVTMLSLISPGVVRKIHEIVKA